MTVMLGMQMACDDEDADDSDDDAHADAEDAAQVLMWMTKLNMMMSSVRGAATAKQSQARSGARKRMPRDSQRQRQLPAIGERDSDPRVHECGEPARGRAALAPQCSAPWRNTPCPRTRGRDRLEPGLLCTRSGPPADAGGRGRQK